MPFSWLKLFICLIDITHECSHYFLIKYWYATTACHVRRLFWDVMHVPAQKIYIALF